MREFGYTPQEGERLQQAMKGIPRDSLLIFEPQLPDNAPEDQVMLIMPEHRGFRPLIPEERVFKELVAQSNPDTDERAGQTYWEGRQARTTSWRLLAELADVPRLYFPETPELREIFRPDYEEWLDQDEGKSLINLYVGAARQILMDRGEQTIAEQSLECEQCQIPFLRQHCTGLGVTALCPTIRFTNMDTGAQGEVAYDIASLIANDPNMLKEKRSFMQQDSDFAYGAREIYFNADAMLALALRGTGIEPEDALILFGRLSDTAMIKDFGYMLAPDKALGSILWQKHRDPAKGGTSSRDFLKVNPAEVLDKEQGALARRMQHFRYIWNASAYAQPTTAFQAGVCGFEVQTLEPFHSAFGELRAIVEERGAKLAYASSSNIDGSPLFFAVGLSDSGEGRHLLLGKHDSHIRVALQYALDAVRRIRSG